MPETQDYLNWVSKFHEFCSIKPDSPFSSNDIHQFLKKISRTYEDWQVQQAGDAIGLYRICKRLNSTTPIKDSVEPAKQWKAVADECGYDIRTIQELLGHASVKTTIIYTHLSKENLMGVKSPLDNM